MKLPGIDKWAEMRVDGCNLNKSLLGIETNSKKIAMNIRKESCNLNKSLLGIETNLSIEVAQGELLQLK